jgi:hypothetical protein
LSTGQRARAPTHPIENSEENVVVRDAYPLSPQAAARATVAGGVGGNSPHDAVQGWPYGQ